MSVPQSLRPLLPVAIVFLVLIGALWWALNGVMERRAHPNRGLTAQSAAQPMLLRRSLDGHYRAPGTINGQPVRFFVDTGATTVVVSSALADRLGLARGRRITVYTAAGPRRAYTTRFKHVTLGSIRIDNVRGSIVPDMRGNDADDVLLGMSFLGHLDMRFRDGELVLR